MITVYCNKDTRREELFSACGLAERGCVMALGFFDGVHVAHRMLLSRARHAADLLSLPLAVFTFSGESGIKSSAPRLYSDRDRLALLGECGADIAIVADFADFSEIEKKDFVDDWLVGVFSTRVAVCGYNFTFGKGAEGDAESLERMLAEHGAQCLTVEELTLDGERVSTTRIRKLLIDGDMHNASRLLGAPYSIFGIVEHGNGRGHTLGIPTVNTALPEGALALPYGVYASALVIDGKAYHALTNIGECPTFGARRAHAETMILDFSGDLYGRELRIYLLEYMRGEREFSSPDALLEQIKLDTDGALTLDLEEIWQEFGLN